MDATFERQLWNAVPLVPAGRQCEAMSTQDSHKQREKRQAELDRLNATLARNQTVRFGRLASAFASLMPASMPTLRRS